MLFIVYQQTVVLYSFETFPSVAYSRRSSRIREPRPAGRSQNRTEAIARPMLRFRDTLFLLLDFEVCVCVCVCLCVFESSEASVCRGALTTFQLLK